MDSFEELCKTLAERIDKSETTGRGRTAEAKMNDIASEMLTTSPNGDESKKYHHVVIRYEEGRHFIFAHPTKRDLDINEFLV